MRTRTILGTAAACACMVAAFSTPAQADTVLSGWDYLSTIGDTWFNFGPGIGVVPFKSKPLDPVNLYDTDTIVHRKQDAILPTPGSSATVPIEMVALSLQSVAPVYVPGPDSFFDVFVVLDMGPDHIPGTGDETPTLGSMTIVHDLAFPDDHANTPEGHFESFFDVFADALFVPVGQQNPVFAIDIDNLTLSSTNSTGWSHSNDNVPHLPGMSNFFLAGSALFPLGDVVEEHPGAGRHEARMTSPEPATLLLLAAGGLALRRRR